MPTMSCAEIVSNCMKASKPGRIVEAMLEMPLRQTTITLNRDKDGSPRKIDWKRRENRFAALAQVTGHLAPNTCKRCTKGTGPFAQCIVSTVCGSGACGNCIYGAQGSLCSFRTEQTAESDEEESREIDDEMTPSDNTSEDNSPRDDTPTPSVTITTTGAPAASAAPAPAALMGFPAAAVVSADMPYESKRALAKWLRDMAEAVEKAADEDAARMGAYTPA